MENRENKGWWISGKPRNCWGEVGGRPRRVRGKESELVSEVKIAELVQAHVCRGSRLLGGMEGKTFLGKDDGQLRASPGCLTQVDVDLDRKQMGMGREGGMALLVGYYSCSVLPRLPRLCILPSLNKIWFILSDHPWITQGDTCLLPLIPEHLMAHDMSWCPINICQI